MLQTEIYANPRAASYQTWLLFYSVHGAIAEHYKVDPAKLKESHSSTIDYAISATAG
ncbi:MAG TPA: hypothetical protein VOA41_07245 [Candidatus Dormibacteraeota bacterium]|nr:hypothetical protein [Candidatus Dormibacteraeota bacterium]